MIFGGKNNFVNRIKNRITKDQFALKRLCPITIQGECLQKGNRSFRLDIIENNQILFKLNKNKHFIFKLPRLRNNFKKELFKLQQLNEVKSKQRGITYSIKFDSKFLYISFEEFTQQITTPLMSNRYLGIDLNPQNIGISVLEDEKVIYTREYNLNGIFKKIFSEKLASSSNRMKYFHNKIKHQILIISKSISILAKHYKCKTVYFESLSFKSTKKEQSQNYNKKGNRKNKNLWKKELFISNFKKRLNIFGILYYEINPAYSSFIGNIQHDYTDPINASIEIARRGYSYKILKKTDNFYPPFDVKHRWKEMATSFNGWKEFYRYIVKKSGMRYRVSLDKVKHKFKVFQQNSSHKSMVINYVFYD